MSLLDDGPRKEATASYMMVCPACGDESGIEQDEDAPDMGVTLHPDHDEYEPDNPLGTRGGWIEIALWCSPCGHSFRLVTANHKGMQLVGIAPLPDVYAETDEEIEAADGKPEEASR